MSLTIIIPGIPQQQGSKTPGINRKTGRAFMREANKNLKPWRAEAIAAAREARAGRPTINGPVAFDVVRFTFPRPMSHYGTGRNANLLKPSAPAYKTGKPDVDKLLRAVSDALTQAGVYRDDSQVAVVHGVHKVYGDNPGVVIVLRELSARENSVAA